MTTDEAARTLARVNLQLENLYSEAERLARAAAPSTGEGSLHAIKREQAAALAEKGDLLVLLGRQKEAAQAYHASLALHANDAVRLKHSKLLE
jgi:predicted RNA polymerase sigma factor